MVVYGCPYVGWHYYGYVIPFTDVNHAMDVSRNNYNDPAVKSVFKMKISFYYQM